MLNIELILGTIKKISIYIYKIVSIKFKAASRGEIEVVKEIMDHNADIEVKDNDGSTPLILGMFLDYFLN